MAQQPPVGMSWFNEWVKDQRLVEIYVVWTGEWIIICSESGAKFLRNAYRYVIHAFEAGYTWHGRFNSRHFLVSDDEEYHFQIDRPSFPSGDANDLFKDMRALNSGLLRHFEHDSCPALYVPHLRFFTTNPPPCIWTSDIYFERYLEFLKYQFVFADASARAMLSDGLSNASTQIGSQHKEEFNRILVDAWDSMGLPRNRNWVASAKSNPIYREMIKFRVDNGLTQFQPRPPFLYAFCRHTDVHGPQKTLAEFLLPENEGDDQAAPEVLQEAVQVGKDAWLILKQEEDVRKAQAIQAQQAAGQQLANAQQRQSSVVLQTMLNPVELSLMLGRDFGRYIAQATAMILIELDLGPFSAYVDEIYDVYKKSIDSK